MITIVAHEPLLCGTINFTAKLECEEVWNSSSELLRNFILEKMEDTSMDPNCISSLLESNWSGLLQVSLILEPVQHFL